MALQSRSPLEGRHIPLGNLPMKWYKALVYVILFVNAGVNVSQGVLLILGMAREKEVAEFYAQFGGAYAVDVIMALLCFAGAGLAIVTRFRLAGYYKNAPALTVLTWATPLLANIIGVIAWAFILPVPVVLELCKSVVASSILNVVMIVANIIYFKKRKHLFTKD